MDRPELQIHIASSPEVGMVTFGEADDSLGYLPEKVRLIGAFEWLGAKQKGEKEDS